MKRILLRLRWLIAAPILRPIIADWDLTAKHARDASFRDSPTSWRIECMARSEILRAHIIELEQAFGCTSFNKQKHYVRHYR